jgi:hypothetical protein
MVEDALGERVRLSSDLYETEVDLHGWLWFVCLWRGGWQNGSLTAADMSVGVVTRARRGEFAVMVQIRHAQVYGRRFQDACSPRTANST